MIVAYFDEEMGSDDRSVIKVWRTKTVGCCGFKVLGLSIIGSLVSSAQFFWYIIFIGRCSISRTITAIDNSCFWIQSVDDLPSNEECKAYGQMLLLYVQMIHIAHQARTSWFCGIFVPWWLNRNFKKYKLQLLVLLYSRSSPDRNCPCPTTFY